MALETFLNSIRAGANLGSSSSIIDSRRLDSEGIGGVSFDSPRWLTPKSVEGYDPNDFVFLSDEEKRRLTECVEQFRIVARNASGDTPAADEQIREARLRFENILKIVRPDKYGDLDAFLLGKAIEKDVSGKLPPLVRELLFETGFDASGDPALWIWVEVDDRTFDEVEIFRSFDVVREELRTAAFRICPERWPFIRLRGISEREDPGKLRVQKTRDKSRK